MTTPTPIRTPASRAVLTAISLGTLAVASGANASPSLEEASDGTHTRTVRFAELDLTRAQGVAVLYERLRRAAQAVCDPFRDFSVLRFRYEQECVEQAVSEAVTKVGNPKVTAYHLAKTS